MNVDPKRYALPPSKSPAQSEKISDDAGSRGGNTPDTSRNPGLDIAVAGIFAMPQQYIGRECNYGHETYNRNCDSDSRNNFAGLRRAVRTDRSIRRGNGNARLAGNDWRNVGNVGCAHDHATAHGYTTADGHATADSHAAANRNPLSHSDANPPADTYPPAHAHTYTDAYYPRLEQ